MPEVVSRLKEEIVCACGCARVGRPRTKAWRDGMHTRDCDCWRCRSGDHAKNEKRRVGKFASRSGLRQASGSGRRLGFDMSGVCAVEESSAVALTEKLRAWWSLRSTQDKLERVRAQTLLPWMFAASWDDRVQLVVMDADSAAALALAAAGSDMELAAQLIGNLEVIFPPCETAGDES